MLFSNHFIFIDAYRIKVRKSFKPNFSLGSRLVRIVAVLPTARICPYFYGNALRCPQYENSWIIPQNEKKEEQRKKMVAWKSKAYLHALISYQSHAARACHGSYPISM